MSSPGYEGLSLLLRAPSKELVVSFFDGCFRHRSSMRRENALSVWLGKVANEWGFETVDEASLMRSSTTLLIRDALYVCADLKSADSCAAYVAETHQKFGLKPALVKLIAKILAQRLPVWRVASMKQCVSLPKFVDAEWRVDVKSASEEVARMYVPTVLIKLKYEEQATRVGEMAGVKSVDFEMSRESLHSLLQGLGRIKEQLDSVSGA